MLGRSILTAVLVLVVAAVAHAQVAEVWVARYTGPGGATSFAEAVVLDAAGGIYVTGYSYGGGATGYDYATVKYDGDGNELWVARYNGPANGWDRPVAIAADATGDVYVTGVSDGGAVTGYDYATVKYDGATGAERWVVRHSGPGSNWDEATAIAVDAAGNVYVTGTSWVDNINGHDYVTLKYNGTTGAEQWTARYNGPASQGDYARAIALDAAGNVYVTGESYDAGGSGYATVKYDGTTGAERWTARYGGIGSGWNQASAITIEAAGVYVTGYSYGGTATSYDYATVKYDGTTGAERWVSRYNGPGSSWDQALAIAADAAGDVYVTGVSYGGAVTGYDYATVKYDGTTGAERWTARWTSPGNYWDQPYDIAVDATGDVYLTGAGHEDYVTIKYSGTTGAERWTARYDGPGNSWDYSTALALDQVGNVYVTGGCNNSIGGYDYATLRYIQSPVTPVPELPANGGELVTLAPTLQVAPVPNAAQYNFRVFHGATEIRNVTIPGNSWVVTPPLEHDRTYTWDCRAWNAAGWGERFGPRWTFIISPDWAPGWVEVAAAPGIVRDGGWLAYNEGDGFIYGAPGNRSSSFWRYAPKSGPAGGWTNLVNGIPAGARPPNKGTSGAADGDNYIYVVKGNNTPEFYRYRISDLTWETLADILPGTSGRNKVKVSALAYHDGYVYLLKGSKTDFMRFNTDPLVMAWENLPDAPARVKPRWNAGSFLVADRTADRVYAHKSRFHDFCAYDVGIGAWDSLLTGMPLVGMTQRSKKAKDGSCGAYYQGGIFALKGGNTCEFFRYDIVGDAWTEHAMMPDFGTTGKRKRVKNGGALAGIGAHGAFFAFKGNKTSEFWRYVIPPTPAGARPGYSGPAAGGTVSGAFIELSPNPVTGGSATLHYSLPTAGPATVTVYDVSGRSVVSARTHGPATGSLSLDLRALPRGIYLVKVEAGGFRAAQKLVVRN